MHRIMLFYFLIVAVAASMFVSSCGKPDYPAVLTRADSLCESSPREAERLLDTVAKDTASMSSDARWYYRLLRLKSADKNYIVPRSNKEAFSVVAHYENGGDSRLLPQAYYYAASVCRDLNDAPQALDFFNKAEELLPEGENLKMRSMINNQCGHILLKQGFTNLAIKSFIKSYHNDVKLKNTDNIIFSLRDIAYAYSWVGRLDSSIFYYNKVIRLAEKMNKPNLLGDIYMQMAGTYVDNKQYHKALEIIHKYKNSFSTDPNTDKIIIMLAYQGVGLQDSAYKYGSEILKSGTIYEKEDAVLCMLKIFNKRAIPDSIIKYSGLYEQSVDSATKLKAQETIARSNALFNYNKYVKANAQLKVDNSREAVVYLIIITLLAVLSVIATSIALRVNIKRKKQYLILGQIKKQQYEQTKEFREENEREILKLEEQLRQYKGKNEELATLLEKQKDELVEINRRSEQSKIIRKQESMEFMKTEIYGQIEKKLSVFKTNPKSGKPLSNAEFQMLDNTVNQLVKDFKVKLYNMSKLSIQEYHICLLIRMRLSVVETSQLIGLTTSAVSVARKRLYKKMTNEEGTGAQLDKMINDL